MPRRGCATSAAPTASPSRCCAFPASTRSTAPAAIRASASRAARRCSRAGDDVHTSHIHADDLARACVAALHRGRPQRAVNVADDSELQMGDYFDLVADRFAMARPPRLARDAAAAVLSPVQMSFLGESRRLVNGRLKHELRLVLRYPTVDEGLARCRDARRASDNRREPRARRHRMERLPSRRSSTRAIASPLRAGAVVGARGGRRSLPTARRRRAPRPGRPSRSASSRRSTPAARSTCSTAILAEKLSQRLGQQVFVDAIPGANTIKGADVVAKAAPDGYTFMITTMSTHVNNTVLFTKLPFDPVKDFAPITQVSLGSVLLTAPGNAPYTDLKGFVAWAKAQKRPISYGSWGVGSSANVYGEILAKDHGVSLTHVPYKGEQPAITDVIGGNLDVTFASPVGAKPQVQSPAS